MIEYNNKNKIEDRYWYPEDVIPYIIKHLNDTFPDSIIIPEFDKVDLMVIMGKYNIPIEIQRTYTYGNEKKGHMVSLFEKDIRTQIEQNIETCGTCWFFLDSKFLEYLQNVSNRQISMNMDWLYNYFKLGKIKIFSISIDGIIKELVDENLNFITRLSSTCKISKDEDYRILQRNKYIIAFNVLKDNGFTTYDINSMYNSFKIDIRTEDKDAHFINWLIRKDCSIRERKYRDILHSINELYIINDMLDCNIPKEKYGNMRRCTDIGLFETNGHGNSKYTLIQLIDKYNIVQYFPGYIRNKELWDYLKIHSVNTKTFLAIIRGEYPNYLKDRKNQKDIINAWS